MKRRKKSREKGRREKVKDKEDGIGKMDEKGRGKSRLDG